jgi:hypothetical protein
VNHQDCIATLLGAATGGGTPEQQDAREHAARCSDCWAVLTLFHELAMGEPPPDAGRMVGLFSCAAVQDGMYLLAGLSAEEMRAAHPHLAAHLGWCLACCERLAEVLWAERAAALGELPAVVAPALPRWRESVGRLGEAVRELVGQLVIEARRTKAAFTAVPEGFVVSGLATAGALRGAVADEVSATGLGQQVRFPLGESGLFAELALETRSPEEVGIALGIAGAAADSGLSVHLREVKDDRADLVARYTVRGAEPVLLKGLQPGRYVLEVHERQHARRFQLRFDIESAV